MTRTEIHPDPIGARALRFVVLVGIVSLFADMTYESARSAIGPYLGLLGAAALVVAAAITWVAWTLASDRGPIGDALRDYVACLEERDPTACESEFRERLLDELGPVPRTGG